ncbi:MAG: GNAT family N-acetyltransferase, partial [Prevotellaceae bacterium]|nr:GNAT family N-acetyltransferase [Prevotellaceae bacterium]
MKHLAGLSQIWREAFHEDDRYIDFFISEGLPLGHLLTYGPKVSPYAALTLFPISLVIKGIDYKGYYLYGLGTLTSERGKGYGSLLVEKAKEFAKERGRHFILLQPTD